MKRFIIVGLGNFGAAVAATLHSMGHEVVALDRDPDRVDEISRRVTRAAVGDGSEVKTLERLGGTDADTAVISTGQDISASAMTALACRDLHLPEVYVKVISQDHARLIEKIGVTETIFPERESGIRLGKRISSRLLLNYVELGAEFGLQEMAVPSKWVGESLRELELRRRHSITVVAVHDMLTDTMQAVPDPDERLKDSDTLIVAGTEGRLAAVAMSGSEPLRSAWHAAFPRKRRQRKNEQEAAILIIDTDDESRTVLKKGLEPLGRHVYVANSGEEALELLADQRIALVLTELDLPGIDGLAVVEKIERELPEVRVLVLTADASVELVEESLRHGALDTIQKPVSARRLRSLVRTILDQEESEGEKQQ